MIFKLDWASSSSSRPEWNDGNVKNVKDAGFTITCKGEILIRDGCLPLDLREWYIQIDSLEELRRLDEVTGKNGLIIRWDDEYKESHTITVYDDYVE